MKKFAIYGREFKDEHLKGLQHFFELMDNRKAEYQIYDHFATYLSSRLNLKADIPTFSRESFDPSDIDIMLSIGGDGTMLDTTTMIKDSNLPILGINTGRLGFLSSINLNQIDDALAQIFEGAYMIDKRTVLKVETDEKIFEDENFALNEVTLHKKDSQSMIVIHVYVDGKFLNTYWADGLIIATPTGSTAYSLSCGGPIILPGSHNLIITPVAPHNLNVRPVLISDQSVITLKMEGRDSNLLMSLDSRSTTLKEDAVVTVQRHSFSINLVRLKNHSFLKTLRNKMHWGYDRRN
jgi:NAD+ kinase